MRKEKSKTGKVKMRNKALFIGIVAIVLAVAAIGANANISTKASDKVNAPDVPHKINYQGYLTDADGNPITGDLDMTFSIYDSPTGGTPLWSETQTSVHVENGLFNVILGSVNPIPGDVFPSGGSRWLETEISGQTLTPRKEIVSVAYAFKADPDGDWDGACTGEMYTRCPGDNVGIGVKDPAHHLEVRGGAARSGALLVEANNLADFTGAMLEFNGINLCGIANIFGGTVKDDNHPHRSAMIKLHPAKSDSNHTSAQHKKVALLADGTDEDKFKIITGIDDSTNPNNPLDIFWRTNGVTAMTITKDGRVGIGTTDPGTAKLAVGDTTDKDTWVYTPFGRSYGLYSQGDKAGVFGRYGPASWYVVPHAVGFPEFSDGTPAVVKHVKGAGVAGTGRKEVGTECGAGIYGKGEGDHGIGVLGSSYRGAAVVGIDNGGIAILGDSDDGWAGYFKGDVNVTGDLYLEKRERTHGIKEKVRYWFIYNEDGGIYQCNMPYTEGLDKCSPWHLITTWEGKDCLGEKYIERPWQRKILGDFAQTYGWHECKFDWCNDGSGTDDWYFWCWN